MTSSVQKQVGQTNLALLLIQKLNLAGRLVIRKDEMTTKFSYLQPQP
jgi:hypothetical protein